MLIVFVVQFLLFLKSLNIFKIVPNKLFIMLFAFMISHLDSIIFIAAFLSKIKQTALNLIVSFIIDIMITPIITDSNLLVSHLNLSSILNIRSHSFLHVLLRLIIKLFIYIILVILKFE